MALLGRQPARGTPVHGSLDLALVRDGALRLFARIDPTSAADASTVATRELPHWYPQSILHEVDKRVTAAVHNRETLYLRGAQKGVGLSWFLTDFARSFNYQASRVGDPRRILYVKFPRGLSSETKFLDELASAARTSVSTSELRLRGSGRIGLRILDSLRLHRVAVLILDHVHNLPTRVRAIIADLISASNPVNRVPLEVDEYGALAPRLGILLAGAGSPEKVFTGDAEEVVRQLSSGEVVFPSYATAVDTADALRQADIGLADLDTSCLEDAMIAEFVFHLTDGRVYLLRPYLQVVDWLARANNIQRPTLKIFGAAVSFNQELRQRLLQRPDPHTDDSEVSQRAEHLRAGDPKPLPTRRKDSAEDEDCDSGSPSSRKKQPSRKEIHEGREFAEHQRQRMTAKPRPRKRHR